MSASRGVHGAADEEAEVVLLVVAAVAEAPMPALRIMVWKTVLLSARLRFLVLGWGEGAVEGRGPLVFLRSAGRELALLMSELVGEASTTE
jgi:hypothetical protein